jgi:beta-phosphoglucomutase family hydrolase
MTGVVAAHRLPSSIRAVLLDLDGVVTDTAAVHARAWQRLFDEFLAGRPGAPPFRLPEEYLAHIDGKPRADGVRDFLAARGIRLPEGLQGDPPGSLTVHGLGARKDGYFNAILDRDGVDVFDSTVLLLQQLRKSGRRTACVSSSRNGRHVLERAGLMGLFDSIVDGTDSAAAGLPGKPAPDSYLEAAGRLHVHPEAAAVVEDAISGVAAGRAGGFGLVIGVDRGAGEQALLSAGADIVVHDLGEVGVA